ncbi:MAG: succinate dehydrogenase assembly factor 2 [Pseudomonadota bacterium]
MTDGIGAEATATDFDARLRRARYRAHYRGTKEMDWLLGRFAEAELGSMSPAQLTTFEQFLALADPDLQGWLMDTPSQTPVRSPDEQFADLIDRIRTFHGLSPLAARS